MYSITPEDKIVFYTSRQPEVLHPFFNEPGFNEYDPCNAWNWSELDNTPVNINVKTDNIDSGVNFPAQLIIEIGKTHPNGVEVRDIVKNPYPSYNEVPVICLTIIVGDINNTIANLKAKIIDNSRLRDIVRHPKFRLWIEFGYEGWGDANYIPLHNFAVENNLQNKIVFSNGNLVIDTSYNKWCAENKKTPCLNFVGWPFWWLWEFDKLDGRNYKRWWGKDIKPTQRMMCLNRRPHPHRMHLLLECEQNNIVKDISYSFPPALYRENVYTKQNATSASQDVRNSFMFLRNYLRSLSNELVDVDAEYGETYQALKQKLPYIVDTDDFSFNHAETMNRELYSNHFINVIPETLYYGGECFLTEKTFKSIGFKQAFIIVGAPGILASLRSLGFSTFSPWIDESYDTIEDPYLRMKAIVREMKRLLEMPEDQFKIITDKIRPLVEHNHKHLLSKDTIKEYLFRNMAKQFINLC